VEGFDDRHRKYNSVHASEKLKKVTIREDADGEEGDGTLSQ